MGHGSCIPEKAYRFVFRWILPEREKKQVPAIFHIVLSLLSFVKRLG
jgi:hypothetical protein